MKHTPGPWKLGSTIALRKIILNSQDEMIAKVLTKNTIENNTNAYLIAAAPEMLEALGMIKYWLDEKQKVNFAADNKIALDTINEAIAKARGES